MTGGALAASATGAPLPVAALALRRPPRRSWSGRPLRRARRRRRAAHKPGRSVTSGSERGGMQAPAKPSSAQAAESSAPSISRERLGCALARDRAGKARVLATADCGRRRPTKARHSSSEAAAPPAPREEGGCMCPAPRNERGLGAARRSSAFLHTSTHVIGAGW
ncbi:MAG: hypothetical protein J3K34DRAFT_10284 [Monoraphidium minutum]|nr:MAG: hypothetical protein J3K34DRAFT_10284 [Monoraphidium minutum]